MNHKITISPRKIRSGDSDQIQLMMRLLSPLSGGSEESEEFYLHTDQLLDILDQLQHSLIDTQQEIHAAIEWASEDHTLVLDPLDKFWLQFLDKLFQDYLGGANLDACLLAEINKLRIPFLQMAFGDPDFFSDPTHVAINLLDLLCRSGQGWAASLEKSGAAYLKAVMQCADNVVAELTRGDSEVWQQYYEKFSNFYKGERSRVSRLEQRVADAHLGEIRAKQAQFDVVEMINSKLSSAILPEFVLEFVHRHLRDELILSIVKGDGSLLKRWRAVLESIAWIFQENIVEKEQQRAYKLASLLTDEFPRLAQLTFTRQTPEVDECIDRFDSALMSLLRGNNVDCIAAPALAHPGQVEGVDTVVSQGLIDNAQALKEGSWYIYIATDGSELRCKLLVKCSGANLFLFVNRNGKKVLQKSVEDIAYCLSVKVLQELEPAIDLSRSIKCKVEGVLSEFEGKQNEIKMVHEQRAFERNEMEKKRHRIEVEKKESAEKARREAAALADQRAQIQREKIEKEQLQREQLQREQLQREQLQREQLQREQSHLEEIPSEQILGNAEEEESDDVTQKQRLDDERKVARLMLDSLSIGAWMELVDDCGNLVKCKLAVKILSTNKFIFVDSFGIKISEYRRNELLDKVMNKEAKFLEQSDSFEERLAKVVCSLRRDKS